jgi:hypothetical protein
MFKFIKVVSLENVWHRVLELKDEMLIFAERQRNGNFSRYLRNEMWCGKLAYVAEIAIE